MRRILAVFGLFVVQITPAFAAETISYTYDVFGRVVAVVHSGTVNNALTTTYNHDSADNRTKVKTTGAS